MSGETDGGVGRYLASSGVHSVHPFNPDTARPLLKRKVEHHSALWKRIVLRTQHTIDTVIVQCLRNTSSVTVNTQKLYYRPHIA